MAVLLLRRRAVTAVADACTLARIRALRATAMLADAAGSGALQASADRAGRRLVGVAAADGGLGIALGWQECDEPAVLDEPLSGVCRLAPPTVQLVLAACLRSCWPDPDKPVYPGLATTEATVLEALDRLGARTPEPWHEQAGSGVYRHRKSALRVLRACGFLAPDAADGSVRLGPAVAQWPAADVDELRRCHHLLPAPGQDPA
jgi:hypothetical protein